MCRHGVTSLSMCIVPDLVQWRDNAGGPAPATGDGSRLFAAAATQMQILQRRLEPDNYVAHAVVSGSAPLPVCAGETGLIVVCSQSAAPHRLCKVTESEPKLRPRLNVWRMYLCDELLVKRRTRRLPVRTDPPSVGFLSGHH